MQATETGLWLYAQPVKSRGRFRKIRLDFLTPLRILSALLLLAPFFIRKAKVVIRLPQAGRQPYRLLKFFDRLIHAAKFSVSESEIVMRIGIIGFKPYRLLILFDRLIRASEFIVSESEIVMCAGIIGF